MAVHAAAASALVLIAAPVVVRTAAASAVAPIAAPTAAPIAALGSSSSTSSSYGSCSIIHNDRQGSRLEPFDPGRNICGPRSAAATTDAVHSARADTAAARGCAVAAPIWPTYSNIGTDSDRKFNMGGRNFNFSPAASIFHGDGSSGYGGGSSSGSTHYFKDGCSSGIGRSNYSSSSICDSKQLSHPRPFDPGPSLPQALLWQIATSISLPLHVHVIAKGLAAAVGAIDPPNEAFSGPERIIFDTRSAAARSAYANIMATRGRAVAGTFCRRVEFSGRQLQLDHRR